MESSIVKRYTALNNWKMEDGLEGAMHSLRQTTLVGDGAIEVHPLKYGVSNELVVQVSEVELLCERVGSIQRKHQAKLGLVGTCSVKQLAY